VKIEKGTRVFITGAASGIGRAVALACAQRGALLFLTDINAGRLDETCRMVAERGGGLGKAEAFDITDLSAVRSFAEEVHQKHGPMDLIMNVAGVALFALVEDMEHSDWERVININLWGPIHVIECFLPEMIKAKRGHVVNVSSTAGLTGAPWHAAYSASKWGLLGLSEVLRYDLMQHNIGVTAVCPGAVDTPLKHSVVILGADMDDPRIMAKRKMFDRHAVSPERVAHLMLSAVEKKKFLVITSFDIKFVYWCKKHFFPLYHYVLIRISRMMNSMRDPGWKRS